MSLFKSWQPATVVDCAACGLPTERPGAGLSVFCPECVVEIRDIVARQSRPYRTSEYGGPEFGGGRRGR